MADVQDLDRSQFKDALVLAVVPGLAYWFAYLYELGYHLYFNLPSSLIDVSLTNVLSAGAAILTTAPIFKSWFDTAHSAFRNLQTGWLRKLFVMVVGGGALLWGFSTVLHLEWNAIALIVGLFVLIMLILGVFHVSQIIRSGLAIQRKERSGLSKDDAIAAVKAEYEQANADVVTSDDLLERHFGRTGMRVFWIFAILSAFIIFWGARSAKNETRFMVTQSPDSRVVLKKYGNQILLAGFDRQSHQLLGDYLLITLSDNSQLRFKYENLGNLEPAPVLPK